MTVTGLQHVLVLSDAIDTSRDFYCEVIGLRAGPRPQLVFPGHWLYAGDAATSCLHIADRDAYLAHAASIGLGSGPRPDATGERDAVAPSVDHVAFGATDDGVERRVRERGLSAVVNETPGGPRQLFVSDPDGVLVEINVAPGRSS